MVAGQEAVEEGHKRHAETGWTRVRGAFRLDGSLPSPVYPQLHLRDSRGVASAYSHGQRLVTGDLREVLRTISAAKCPVAPEPPSELQVKRRIVDHPDEGASVARGFTHATAKKRHHDDGGRYKR
jgi:hypothetical protein